jgi:predicted AlkP superfamily pyrophosphatase or phosphodiesterase
MKNIALLVLLFGSLPSTPADAASRKLLVISVDGLDYRYLRDADSLKLKIPHMRRLMREGLTAQGVVGVVPTITWPSHTTLITGVPPAVHGILGNRRPAAEGGEYYWDVSLLKVPTLLDAARKAGLKSAAVTWPVTVNAPVDYNLPEYFRKRQGGSMDLPSIETKATPGLVEEIAKEYPSFPQEWMEDRTRAQATAFLVARKNADLVLTHLVDHDAEAHESGPFSREALAKVEYSDELIGQILLRAPSDYVVAIVSDHGFERTDTEVDIRQRLNGAVATVTPYLLIANSEDAARKVHALAAKPENGIGKEVALADLKRFAPQYTGATAAWESAPHHAFRAASPAKDQTPAKLDLHSKPREKGNHGLWPLRADYRSVFVLHGPGVKAGSLPELQMTDIAARFAEVLEVPFPFTR